MMTRGSIYFKIQDALEQGAEDILSIGLFSDAYPSGAGQKIFDALKNCNVTSTRSVERAFLGAFGDWESDYLMDDEYVYIVTIKPFLTDRENYNLLEISHFEVIASNLKEKEVIFKGEHIEFERFIED